VESPERARDRPDGVSGRGPPPAARSARSTPAPRRGPSGGPRGRRPPPRAPRAAAGAPRSPAREAVRAGPPVASRGGDPAAPTPARRLAREAARGSTSGVEGSGRTSSAPSEPRSRRRHVAAGPHPLQTVERTRQQVARPDQQHLAMGRITAAPSRDDPEKQGDRARAVPLRSPRDGRSDVAGGRLRPRRLEPELLFGLGAKSRQLSRQLAPDPAVSRSASPRAAARTSAAARRASARLRSSSASSPQSLSRCARSPLGKAWASSPSLRADALPPPV